MKRRALELMLRQSAERADSTERLKTPPRMTRRSLPSTVDLQRGRQVAVDVTQAIDFPTETAKDPRDEPTEAEFDAYVVAAGHNTMLAKPRSSGISGRPPSVLFRMKELQSTHGVRRGHPTISVTRFGATYRH